MQSFVIKKDSVGILAMRTERLSVVRHHSDQSLFVETVLANLRDQFAHGRISVGDFSVVRLGCKSCFEGLRRIVWIVRVIQMDPEKKGTVGQLAEPRQSMIYHLSCAALNRFVSIHTVTAQIEISVINIKSAIKTRGRALQRIENQRTDKRACVVSLSVQQVGQIWETR